FLTHSPFHDFTVSIVNKEHYITTRVPDFNISDEMYHIKICVPSKVTLLAQTPWQNKQMPMAYVKEYGKGRVAYLANGHDLRAWKNPEFQKLLIRSIAWSTGAEKAVKKVWCGILGFGGMASGHARWITGTEGLELVAVCDISPERIEAAKHTCPGLKGYFTDIEDMLVMDGLDLVVVVLPHNLHAPMALKCLEAGKHVIVEKPFCITVDEADSMINKAREKNVMLSVFHNRRWDTDYRIIMDLIDRGVIGEVFHIECFIGGYGHPGFGWRSNKEVSGGIIYDWGAHFLDWILNIIRSEVKQVMGNFQKKIWYSVTNEDHGQVYILFENGVTADLMVSNMAASKRPQWRILGTKGSIEADWTDEIHVISYAFGVKQDYKVKFEQVKDRWAGYYRNIADHLLMGEELIVKPEEARTVIAVIEAAQKSSELGMSVPLQ
ncbi:MAG: Gfo/Idh/MocA family oxidoreductase, partial [Clostridiales bacterium]|nr:Gfo/Idh/MocA family oxidoreductase [Clostridiales bacterium]